MSYREYRRRRGTCTLVQKEKLAKESRNRFWSGFGFPLLVWISIAGCVAGVSSTFEWEVFIVVFLVLFVTSFLFFKCLESYAFGSTPVAKALTEVKAVAEPKSEQCSHGIKSPNTDCPECIAFFAAERLAGLERAEIDAKANKIKKDAFAHEKKELERLRAAWRQKPDSFFSMPWQQFEDEIAVCFSKLGYQVEQTSRTCDGGFDGKLTKDGCTQLYECKSGKQNIGRREIQIFHSAIITEKATGGIYVNTGSFIKNAVEYAAKANVTLIDGAGLQSFVAKAHPVSMTGLVPLSVMCVICGEVVTVEGLPETATCSASHVTNNRINDAKISSPDGGLPHPILETSQSQNLGSASHNLGSALKIVWVDDETFGLQYPNDVAAHHDAIIAREKCGFHFDSASGMLVGDTANVTRLKNHSKRLMCCLTITTRAADTYKLLTQETKGTVTPTEPVTVPPETKGAL